MTNSGKDWKRLSFSIFVLLVLVGAVVAGVILVGQEQDIRDKASSDNNACSNALESCDQSSCCSGLVCQGSTGNKFCQQPQEDSCNSGGAVCGGNQGFIGFKCDKLTNGQCNNNARTFSSFSEAASYAGGCGQVDEVWVNGPCNRNLCGGFEVFNSSCSGSSGDDGDNNNDGGSGRGCGSVCTVGVNNGPDCPSCQDDANGAMGDGIGKCWCGNSDDDDDDDRNGIDAQCLNVTVYDDQWNLITSDKFSTLSEGDVIRLNVKASTNGGNYNMARFIINGVTMDEVTARRPGLRPRANEFYYEYTIPAGLEQLSVQAQLHHSSLGWF